MKKSKILALVLAVCLAVSMLTACSTPAESESAKTPESKTESTAPASSEVAEVEKWDPKQDITIRIPVGAGGSFDLAARIFGQCLQKNFDATVLVTNLTGAAGSVALADLNQYDPNAAEMMGGNIGMFTVAPLFTPDLGMKLEDFEIITSLASDEFMICSSPENSGVKTWEDLKELSKTKRILVSSDAPGSTSHALITAIFAEAGITDYDIISKDAGVPRLAANVAGDTDVTIVPDAIIKQYVQEGTIYPILTFSAENSQAFKDEGIEVPSAKSLGHDYVFRTNNFIMVRKGADTEATKQIFAAYQEWQDTDEFKTAMKDANLIPYTFNGEETAKEIQAAADMFKEIYETYYKK